MNPLLCDLIKLAGFELGDFKVHLATGDANPPLAAFFDGKFEEWQEYGASGGIRSRAAPGGLRRPGDLRR